MLPFLRLSDLTKEHDQKRAAFQLSLNKFTASLREKAKPKTLLRDHPQILIGALVLLASMATITKEVLFSSKWRGMVTKLLTFAAGTGFRFLSPVVKGVVSHLLHQRKR